MEKSFPVHIDALSYYDLGEEEIAAPINQQDGAFQVLARPHSGVMQPLRVQFMPDSVVVSTPHYKSFGVDLYGRDSEGNPTVTRAMDAPEGWVRIDNKRDDIGDSEWQFDSNCNSSRVYDVNAIDHFLLQAIDRAFKQQEASR